MNLENKVNMRPTQLEMGLEIRTLIIMRDPTNNTSSDDLAIKQGSRIFILPELFGPILMV